MMNDLTGQICEARATIVAEECDCIKGRQSIAHFVCGSEMKYILAASFAPRPLYLSFF